MSIGSFLLKDAHATEDVTEEDARTIEEILSFMDRRIVDEATEKKIRNGMRLSLNGKTPLLMMNRKEQALAVYEKKADGFFYCKRGLWK